MTELWLLRHGQTDWNVQGRWQGQAPYAPGLNETGRAQALAAHRQLIHVPFAAVYSSDLLRARQTAELIAVPRGLRVHIDTRLREMNLGVWEGMPSGEIRARFPRELEQRERDPYHTRSPGGESPGDVAARVLAAVEAISARHNDDPVLIVSHGLSLALILCRALGIPPEKVYEHIPANAVPTRVIWKRPREPRYTP
jgi:broad specificity phosphatase PhoE